MYRYTTCCLYLSLCLAPLAYANTEYAIPPAISYSDGLFYDSIPNTQPGVCSSKYIPPVFDPNFPDDETVISAEEVLLSQTGTSILAGDVILNQKNRRIYSDEVFLSRNAAGEITTIDSPGMVLLEQPDFRLLSDNGLMLLEGGTQTTLNNTQYRYYPEHARGTARRVEYTEGAPTLLYNANYTTCNPDSNVWKIQGTTVRLNQETGRGEVYNGILKVHDVPIFYSPYMNFPIDDRRQTGFLMPEFGYQTDSGLIFSTPYYFNLAPNYDATFYPRYYTERGLQYGGEFRYMDLENQMQIFGTYLGNDQEFAAFQEEQRTNPSYPYPFDPRLTGVTEVDDDRWNFVFLYTGEYDENWDSSVEYNKASDDNYFVDLGTDIYNRDERELLQRAQINYVDETISASALVQDYQILQPFENDLYAIPYQILPHVEVDVIPDELYWDNTTALNTQFTYFDHIPDPVTDTTPTIGSRAHGNPIVQRPMRRSYGYLLPSVEYRYTQYNLSLSPQDAELGSSNDISRSLPTFYLDGGLIFDRDTEFMRKSFLQTLEPRLFYLYTPFVDQNEIPLFDTSLYDFNTDQLFRTNRFNGLDRIADANQISAAVTTRFFETETGVERFQATIGQILYFEDREVVLCDVELDPYCSPYENLGNDSTVSPLVGNLRYMFSQNWYAALDARYDPTPAETDRLHLLFYYLMPASGTLHFGFRYDESGNDLTGAAPGTPEAVLLQSDTGVILPVHPQWTLLGRWYYDIQNDYTVEAYSGIEYESCCWALRAGARRYLVGSNEFIDREYDTQVFLQFIFKGLAGVGPSPVNLLVDTIPGYTDRFDGGNY